MLKSCYRLAIISCGVVIFLSIRDRWYTGTRRDADSRVYIEFQVVDAADGVWYAGESSVMKVPRLPVGG